MPRVEATFPAQPDVVRHASFVHGYRLLWGFVHHHLKAVRPSVTSIVLRSGSGSSALSFAKFSFQRAIIRSATSKVCVTFTSCCGLEPAPYGGRFQLQLQPPPSHAKAGSAFRG